MLLIEHSGHSHADSHNHNTDRQSSGTSQGSIDSASDNAVVRLSFAESIFHLHECFRVVYDAYLERGYIHPHPSQLHFRAQQLYSGSTTIMARHEGSVVGTATFVFGSSPLEVPSYPLFQNQFDAFRRAGRSLVEGTLLSCMSDKSQPPRFSGAEISVAFIRSGLSICIDRGIDDFCVVVNPAHVPFWRDRCGFEELASTENCPHVRGAPGVLVRLDVRAVQKGTAKCSAFFRAAILEKLPPAPPRSIDDWLDEDDVLGIVDWAPELVSGLLLSRVDLLKQTYPRVYKHVCARTYRRMYISMPLSS